MIIMVMRYDYAFFLADILRKNQVIKKTVKFIQNIRTQ